MKNNKILMALEFLLSKGEIEYEHKFYKLDTDHSLHIYNNDRKEIKVGVTIHDFIKIFGFMDHDLLISQITIKKLKKEIPEFISSL